MQNTLSILDKIDKNMSFDVWYNIKSDKQKEVLLKLMTAGLLPDCEFNKDYSKFRKVKTAYDKFIA